MASAAKVVNFRGVLAGLVGGLEFLVPSWILAVGRTLKGALITLETICCYSLLVIGVHIALHYSLGGGSRGEESDRLPRRVLAFLPSLWTPNVFSTEFNHQTQLGPFTPDAD